jgi:hypothetical protein
MLTHRCDPTNQQAHAMSLFDDCLGPELGTSWRPPSFRSSRRPTGCGINAGSI